MTRAFAFAPPSMPRASLVARQATIHLNTGAYAENSPMVCRKAANRIVGPYRIPNVKIDCLARLHEHRAGEFLSRIGRGAGHLSR